MNIKFFFIYIILFLSFNFKLKSQNLKIVRDLRLRTNIEIEKKIFDRFTVNAGNAAEFEKNISRIGKYFIEGGFGYTPVKFLSTGIEYRHTWNRKAFKNEFKHVNRFAILLEGKYNISRLQASYRLKYQTLDDDLLFYENGDQSENIFRNRVKLKYNLRKTKITPILSSELYLQSDEKVSASQLKTTVGLEYKIKKIGKISACYKAEKELNNNYPYFFSTFEFKFCFSI